MRYSASEKFEIIELVEQSSLSIPRTLAPIGIPRSTFYDWYSRYQEGGIEALEDGKPRPRRIWNKIPDKIETAIVNLALEEPDRVGRVGNFALHSGRISRVGRKGAVTIIRSGGDCLPDEVVIRGHTTARVFVASLPSRPYDTAK
jgi:transposase-like protein